MPKVFSGEAFRMLSEVDNIMKPDQELENKEFQVLRTGIFRDPRYGVFEITEERLQTLKDNFERGVLGIDVALDVNHEPAKGAFAWLKSLEIRNGTLYAKFKDFTQDGRRYFKEKVFKYFSVEFAPFETVENGQNVTIKDVLRGIALTNRPVIKGMQPTFLSEELKTSFIKKKTMSLKVFCEHVLQRGDVSKKDVDAAKIMFATLSEEEQAEVKEPMEKLEAEAAKAGEAEGDQPKEPKKGEEPKPAEGEPAKPTEGEPAKPAEGAAPDAVAAAELAEKDKLLAEKDAKLAEYEAAEKGRKLSETVNGLMLSEANLTAFAKESKDKLTAFVQTLSEEQVAQFSELVKEVRTVDKSMLSELGHGGKTELAESGDEEAMLKEASELAKKYEAEGMKKHMAVERAQKEVFGSKK